jgi:hypothetical protein
VVDSEILPPLVAEARELLVTALGRPPPEGSVAAVERRLLDINRRAASRLADVFAAGLFTPRLEGAPAIRRVAEQLVALVEPATAEEIRRALAAQLVWSCSGEGRRSARSIAAAFVVRLASAVPTLRLTPRACGLLAVAGRLEVPCRFKDESDDRMERWRTELKRARRDFRT